MPAPSRLRRAAGAAARLRARDLLTVVRVIAVAGLVEVGLRLLPLPALARWLGVGLHASDGAIAAAPPAPWSAAEVRQVRIARRVISRWPLGGGPCLRQSLVVGHLLRRRSPVLRLGVARAGDGVLAHAWIEVSRCRIGDDRGFVPLTTTGTGR